MAIINKTALVKGDNYKALHTTMMKKFSVSINSGSAAVELGKVTDTWWYDREVTNFKSITLAQTILVGVIQARLADRTNTEGEVISYEVRSGADAISEDDVI